MRVEALAGVTVELPEAKVFTESADGTMRAVSGFIVRDGGNQGERVIILKIGVPIRSIG